ncbi:unnamed protein product [Allacma fusca]|uniref:Suppressor of white apricot N-terminal domain-containing protein n=1 Tax=Allacma fusca TaxID=39272 RepID=A0A8J2KAC7_9HEXA|nr:unnamed protein product [Allacma fusca]
MWHEARKHEKKLRVLIVDYRRRAERRREYYEKFKADPAQFMQVHGRPCKIYMDPQVTSAADNCMMPWQGNAENMIDRFDARAHLDRIPDTTSSDAGDVSEVTGGKEEEAALNYERYRILIQNDLAGISEDKFLHQIYVEEQFGTPTPVLTHGSKGTVEPGKGKAPKAAIGYTYEDSTPTGTTMTAAVTKTGSALGAPSEAGEEESDEDIDFDLLVNVKDLNLAQQAELNNGGVKYGMSAGDFMRYLNADLEEKEQMRLAKLQEEEKQTMSGRKARRERRAYKDRIIMRKGYVSPPSYAARTNTSPTGEKRRSTSRSESRSISPSPEKITYITSFGGNETDDEKKRSKAGDVIFGPVLPPDGLPLAKKWRKRRSLSKSPRRRFLRSRSRSWGRNDREYRSNNDRNSGGGSRRRRSSSSSDRSSFKTKSSRRKSSASRTKINKSRSRSRSHSRRGRSRDRRHSRNRPKSRSKSRRSSYSRSRSRNRGRNRRKSHSRSHDRNRSRNKHSRRSSRRRSRRRSSSSRRDRSGSRSRSSRKRKSYSSSSSSSSRSPARRVSIDTIGKKNNDSNTSTSLGNNNGDSVKLPSPPVKRYYDKAKAAHEQENSDASARSSDSSDSERNSASATNRNEKFNSSNHSVPSGKPSVSASSKGGTSSSAKLTPQERLKRRMQLALNRQLKADKEAEKSRIEKQVQERLEREESLRELSIKYRRREREKRHRNQALASDSSKSSASSRSHSRSRSRSGSPCLEF